MILVWRDPVLRVAGAALLLCGAMIALVAPYQSLLAISVFGLPETAFSGLFVTASLVTVGGSLWAGIATDRSADRRAVALGSAGIVLAGAVLMAARPAAWSFVLAHALLLPAGFTLMGQIFALARLAVADWPMIERDTAMTAVRALFAVPFIVVLPLWAAALRAGADLLWLYVALAGIAVLLLGLIGARWPSDRKAAWAGTASGLSVGQSLGEILRPAIFCRICLVGAVSGGAALYMVLLPLVFENAAGRDESQVALFAGLVAGLEIPFMIALPLLLRRAGKTGLIAGGAALYGLYLVLFPQLAPSAAVWALVLPAAAAGAVILSLPIAYLQDLMGPRAGAGGALLAVQKVIGDVICAAVFAVGAALSGYALAAVLGALAMTGSALALFTLDRRGARSVVG